MSNHKEIILNYNEFNDDNIIFIKPYAFYKVTKNMGIYYNKEIIPDTNIDTDDSAGSDSNRSEKKNKKKLKIQKPIFKRQKIIIQTPKMMVPFGIKEFINKDKKSYQMTLSFAPISNLYNENEVKKFFMFMRKIDNVIEETITEHIEEWNLPSKIKYTKSLKKLSNDFPHMFNMNLPYDEKEGYLFNTYNESAVKSTIDIIERRCVVSAIIELTDLRFGLTDYRANWNVMQIRKFKPYSPIQEFFMSGCFIIDEDDPEDQAYAQMIETYQKKLQRKLPSIPSMQQYYTTAMNQMQYHVPMPMAMSTQPHVPSSLSIVPPPPPPPKQSEVKTAYVPPSESELKNMLGKLKKTTTVEKVATMGKVIDDNHVDTAIAAPEAPPLPPLPPILSGDKKMKSSKIKELSDSDIDNIIDTTEPVKNKHKKPSVDQIKKKSNNAVTKTTEKKMKKKYIEKD